MSKLLETKGVPRRAGGAFRGAIAIPFAVKFAEGAAEGTVFGYGAAFDNVDGKGDMIVKGAFKETLREHKKNGTMPAMLMQHGGWGIGADDLTPVGVWTAMSEDDQGLAVEGRLALKTKRGADAYELLRMDPRPALNGLSIGYVAKAWEIGTKPGEPRRTLKKIELWEVSLVTFPANPKTRVEGIKAIDAIESLKDAESILREAGFSRAEAVAFIARIKATTQREAGDGLTDWLASAGSAAAVLQPLT